MSKLLTLVSLSDATLLYLFETFMIGFIHKADESVVKGFVFGIWRFQMQWTIGYSDKLEDIGEMADA